MGADLCNWAIDEKLSKWLEMRMGDIIVVAYRPCGRKKEFGVFSFLRKTNGKRGRKEIVLSF